MNILSYCRCFSYDCGKCAACFLEEKGFCDAICFVPFSFSLVLEVGKGWEGEEEESEDGGMSCWQVILWLEELHVTGGESC